MRLESVAEPADRRQVLRATVEAGAALRGVPAPAVPAPGVDPWFDRRMEEPKWRDPLTVMMAGLTALDTRLVDALALGRQDLALRLADRERARVEQFGRGAPAGLMAHMAAYVTASGGLPRDLLRQAAKAESESIGLEHPGGWRALADAVGEALGDGKDASAVQPDVVGEALLLRVWGGEDLPQGCEAVVRAVKARGQQVAASVIRSAQDFCVGDKPREEPLAWLDALIAAARTDLSLLWRIESELPEQTLALRERAVEVDSILAAALRERADADRDAEPERARVLNNLGVRLGDLGRREEALQAADEAVRPLPSTGRPAPRRLSPRPCHVAQQPRQQAERPRAARGGAPGC